MMRHIRALVMGAFLVALVAAIVPSCIFDNDIVFDVDPAFTPEQHDMIFEAADRWNVVTNRTISFRSEGTHHIRLRHPGPGFDGVRRENNIYIRPGLTDDRFFAVVLHEMGHMLDLKHICRVPGREGDTAPNAPFCDPENPLGVMEPSSPLPFIAEADVVECRRVGSCD